MRHSSKDISALRALLPFSVILAAVLGTAVGREAVSSADEPMLRVSFGDDDNSLQHVDGRLIVEAVDKSFLLLGRDGRLWSVLPDQLRERTTLDQPFSPLSREELSRELLAEFGEGFEVLQTKHYVICANTGKKYAQWCGVLFERLMSAFRGHWRSAQVEWRDPEMPLVAVVFADRRRFAEYATRDHGAATANSQGYYSIRTNRIALFDLTSEVKGGQAAGDIGAQLEASLGNVATIVHEATHQLAFNCGLQTRYAENPLWLVEGMAMYFETPDVRSPTGWKTLGRINPARMQAFASYVKRGRPADSLTSLLSSDDRLTNAESATDAYAEAWAFTYFLIKNRRKQYTEFLKRISQKRPLVFGKPEDRLAEFRSIFGEDLSSLDRDFLRYMSRQ